MHTPVLLLALATSACAFNIRAAFEDGILVERQDNNYGHSQYSSVAASVSTEISPLPTEETYTPLPTEGKTGSISSPYSSFVSVPDTYSSAPTTYSTGAGGNYTSTSPTPMNTTTTLLPETGYGTTTKTSTGGATEKTTEKTTEKATGKATEEATEKATEAPASTPVTTHRSKSEPTGTTSGGGPATSSPARSAAGALRVPGLIALGAGLAAVLAM